MDKDIKKIFRWGLIISLLIISLVPNGKQFIPMLFTLLGSLASFFNGKKDIGNNESSGKLKLVLSGFLFLIFLFFTFRRITNWRSLLG